MIMNFKLIFIENDGIRFYATGRDEINGVHVLLSLL